MKFLSIPVLATGNNNTDRFGEAVKQNLEALSGQSGAKLSPLPLTATNAQIVERLNALLARTQAS